MAKITKVPDGPLVKKKGPFKGSTLKAGGKIKKAQDGTMKKSWNQMSPTERAATQTEIKATRGREGFSKYMDSVRTDQFAKGAERRGLTVEQYAKKVKNDDKVKFAEVPGGNKMRETKSANTDGPSLLSKLNPFGDKARCIYTNNRGKAETKANGGKVKKAKTGAMIKRADGSTSQRGLWDNIRANKGSGKKPTAAMLKQEKKIKAKAKK